MGCVASDTNQSQFLTKPSIYFVLGGPGSGKGTQSDYLVRDYKFKHLSVGDLLRQQKTKGGALGQQIQKCMKQGKLVPSQIAVKLIRKSIAINGVRRYLIDGFPRNKQNYDKFKQILKDEVTVNGLIYFQCSHQVMTQRILERAKTSGRVDDNPQAIKLRLKTFEDQTLPVLQSFKNHNNFIKVNAEKTPNQVYADLKQKLTDHNILVPKPAEVFFVLGGPGSGKGTQCQFMVKQYGFRHLSTGDLLRQAVKNGTPKGKQIQNCMKEGKLVSSQLLIQLVKQKMEKYNYSGRYLLDGFPRGQENIDVWNKIMNDVTNIRGVLFFKCQQKQLVVRLLQRAKTSGRADDNQQTIKKRIKVFNQQTSPVIETYGKSGKLITIDAMRSIDKVSQSVRQQLRLLAIQPKKRNQNAPKLIMVIGGPGSGKGTVCDRIKLAFGFQHLSTGDLLRQEQSNNGLYADLLGDYLREGKLVPSQILIQLMIRSIRNLGNRTILIDGFPRNQQNIDKWNQIVGSQYQFTNMLYYQCSQSVMQKRLLQRGKTSGRSDDNAATIKKRFEVFNKQTKPIAIKLDKKGFSLKINAQKDPDTVFQQTKAKLIQAGYKSG